MPTYIPLEPFVRQFEDDAGKPLSGGSVEFYDAGTSTPATVAFDSTGSATATSATLDSGGYIAQGGAPKVLFGEQGKAYKFVVKNSAGTTIYTIDDVGGRAAPFAAYTSTQTYSQDGVVLDDGDFYISLVDSNQGNDPSASATQWSKLVMLREWNTNETYAAGDTVRASDDLLYTSLTGSNAGNDPTSDDTNWQRYQARDLPWIDALGEIQNSSVLTGSINITSVTESPAGTFAVVFDNAAPGTLKQYIFCSPTSTGATWDVNMTSTTAATITFSADPGAFDILRAFA